MTFNKNEIESIINGNASGSLISKMETTNINSDEFIEKVKSELNSQDIKSKKQEAIAKGNDFQLVSVNVVQQYIDNNGELLTTSKVEEYEKANRTIEFVNLHNVNFNKTPTLKEIKNWELKQANRTASLSSNVATFREVNEANRAYPYTTMYLFAFEEVSGDQKRNYFSGNLNWSVKAYGGDINTARSDFSENELIVLGWNRGPSEYTSRSISLGYEALYNTTRKTITNPKEHIDSNGYTAAYQFNALPYIDSERWVLTSIHIRAYSTWYMPSRFGDRGQAGLMYANGYSNTSISGFSISVDGTFSIDLDNSTNYDRAKYLHNISNGLNLTKNV